MQVENLLNKIKSIVILFLILTVLSCKQDETWKTVVLQDGIPDVLEKPSEFLPYSILNHAYLETVNDSIQIIVGTMVQDKKEGNWIAYVNNQQVSSIISSKFPADSAVTVDLKLENLNKKVSFKSQKIDEDHLKFTWLSEGDPVADMRMENLQQKFKVGSQFEPIELQDMGQKFFSTADFENEFIIINLWSTTCRPCLEEIPQLNELTQKYKDEDKFKFLAITYESKDRIESFLENRPFDYEMSFAGNDLFSVLGGSFPVNLIVDPEGKIIFSETGANESTPDEIQNVLNQHAGY